MGILSDLYTKIANTIAAHVIGEVDRNPVIMARRYRLGVQRRQLTVKPNQYDDNITLNLCGVITDRAVSQLVGHHMQLDFEGDTETQQETWLRACLDANNWDILSQRMALSAAEAGTGFCTLQPDGVIGEDGQVYPRIIMLNPEFMSVGTLPHDWEIITAYKLEYKTTGLDGKEISIRRVYSNDAETNAWVIRTYESKDTMNPERAKWVLVDEVVWGYDFPPVLSWQNLPSIDSVYGRPEIGPDGYEIQDRLNAVNSNISKITRLFAHPKQALVNASAGERVDIGPDQILNITTEGKGAGDGFQVYPPSADITGSMQFSAELRRTLFDITRTVDIDSMQDKLGQLTNFGLRVLYQDNISKVETKRELFGEMVEELGRRLFLMAGIMPVKFDIVWPDVVPPNMAEQAQYVQALQGMGVMSKETAANELGLDWEQERERIDGEKTAQDNIGAALLTAFDRGQ